ncbi:hypothetical protein [Streptomyces daliensis]
MRAHESGEAVGQERSGAAPNPRRPATTRTPDVARTSDVAHEPDAAPSPASVPALQRSMGNAAVTRMLQTRRREAAPTTGTPVVQRVTSPAEEQFNKAGYSLAFLSVPAEEFGEDGAAPDKPDTARVGRPRAGEIEILRTPKDWAPPPARGRRAQPQTSIRAKFRSSFFTYEVELVNDPQGASHGNPSLIDLNAPFEIRSWVLRGSQGRSQGRTYAFGDRWAHNPVYWAAAGGFDRQQAEKLADSHGLDPDTELLTTDDDFDEHRLLPHTDSQPFLYYVPQRQDPRFRTDNRQFLGAPEFDALPGPKRNATAVSVPPEVDRRDGGRSTAKAMGNTQAHQWMGPGMGGAPGVLAAYEWCHLIGDGDNGPDIWQNLVIGSNAVNTEQLAMETALRRHVTRLRWYGYGIQMRVQAQMEPAPEQTNPATALPSVTEPLKARWISYHISIVPLATPDTDRPVADVHRQIMDADRGTITEAEFSYLHHEVHNKIKAAIDTAVAAGPAAGGPAPGGPAPGGQGGGGPANPLAGSLT